MDSATERKTSRSAARTIRRAAWTFWAPWGALGTLLYWVQRERWEWIGGPWVSPFTFGLPWFLFGLVFWFPLYFWLKGPRD
jgi:hypothetical protein